MTAELIQPTENYSSYGRLVILTGATASGKTEIKNRLEERGVRRIVSATTRAPREGEVPRVDYHFYSIADFNEGIAQGNFVEWAEYNGNFYGTPKSELEPLFYGQNLITSTEIKGAVDFKENIQQAYDERSAEVLLARLSLVFVGLEFLHVAKTRFLGREKNPTGAIDDHARESLKRRLRTDWEMWNLHREKFDRIVTNREGQLDSTVEEIEKLFRS